VISERLGHASVAFTLQTYGHVIPGMHKDQAEVGRELERAAAVCGLLRDEPRQTMRTIASARPVGMAHPRGVPERPAGAARGRDRHQQGASHHSPFHPSRDREPPPER
jgi:hypothetical protein